MSRAKPLTDREIRALKGPCEKAVGGVGGLMVRVWPDGSRTFVLRYRTKDGTKRSYNLGHFPDEVSLGDARDKAGALRGQIRDGRDPVQERVVDRLSMRMIDLFGRTDPDNPRADAEPGWYLGEYVQTAGKLGTAKTPKGIANDRYYIAAHLRSRKALMRKRVDAVDVADLNRIKAAVTPSAWRKIRNMLLIAFRHAEEKGAIPPGSNPAARTKVVADAKRTRYLTPEERKRLDELLDEYDRDGIPGEGQSSAAYVRLFRLLLLTGMRLGEVLDLRWEWIDWHHEQIDLPTSKTGRKRVPLTPEAVRFLKRELGQIGRLGRVCGYADGGRLASVSRAWGTVREAAELPDVRIHDLRHSWASDAVSSGVPLYVVGKVLGHTTPTTTARYSHVHDEAIKAGLRKAGRAIAKATKGQG